MVKLVDPRQMRQQSAYQAGHWGFSCQKTEACKKDGLTDNGNPTSTDGDDGNGVVGSVGVDSDHDRV